MCIIIDKPAGIDSFPLDLLEAAVANNPHGFGVMWADSGQVVATKELSITVSSLQNIFKNLGDSRAVFHLRYATVGGKSLDNVHPFPVLTRKEHGVSLWMAHNGTISVPTKEGESDTKAFIRDVLRPLLGRCPDFISEPAFQALVSSFVADSKLVFLDEHGAVVRTNEELGDVEAGCWVSNTYSFRRDLRTPKKAKKAKAWAWWEEEETRDFHTSPEPLMDFMGWEDDLFEYTPSSGSLKTTDLMHMRDTEIFELVCNSPELVTDWIVEQLR